MINADHHCLMMILQLFVILVLLASNSHADAIDFKDKCRNHIRKIVCLVDAPSKEPDRYKDHRACLKSSAHYARQVLEAYNQFPSFAQQAVCGLQKIYIEKDFFGPAWSALDDESDPTTGLIGLRKMELDLKPGLQKYNSWFEQQSFGGLPLVKLKPGLPVVVVNPRSKRKTTFLVYTLLHEVGHIFDYQKKFNGSASPKDWTALSWFDLQNPKPELDFPDRKKICLNNCNGIFLPTAQAGDLYRSLYSHGFISQLSAINAMEDFAETFAVYTATKYMGLQFEIQTAEGIKFNLEDILASREFSAKKKFLNDRF